MPATTAAANAAVILELFYWFVLTGRSSGQGLWAMTQATLHGKEVV